MFCRVRRSGILQVCTLRKAAAQLGQRALTTAPPLQPAPTMLRRFADKPLAYLTIPVVAAGVGYTTNLAGVKMLFYPLEYVGVDLYRPPLSPYGVFGWQGVVPTKAEKMAQRLVMIITEKLLSLPEAFARLDPATTASLLVTPVEEAIRRDAPNGAFWAAALKPLLPWALRRVVRQIAVDVDDVLDLERVVMSAFRSDVRVLVELFESVGRVELAFLVNSGVAFGFALGLVQMGAWLAAPQPWTLPIAGALVGYVTNWLAIKLIFEPVEPVSLGPLGTIQGLFEKRQPEVSDEFSIFLAERVLTSPRLLDELVNGRYAANFDRLLRSAIPFVVPDAVVAAAKQGLADTIREPEKHPELHAYIAEALSLRPTLSERLKQLSPSEFEDLLHPVFQEDEITLIAVGGVLGAIVGVMQFAFGWGGPAAVAAAVAAS